MSFFTKQHQRPKEVVNRLIKISDVHQGNRLIMAVDNILDGVADTIYRQAPVKTGYMRSTIRHTTSQNMSEIRITARYARYVDQGRSPTGRRTANPFFSRNIVGLSMELIITVRHIYGMIK